MTARIGTSCVRESLSADRHALTRASYETTVAISGAGSDRCAPFTKNRTSFTLVSNALAEALDQATIV